MARKTNEKPPEGKIIEQTIEEVMHNSMMPYSEHVILERALPRVEDGLKPVQRRILFAMHAMGLTPEKAYRKCATIVGEVMGKYHPHGDSSIYDTLVRMAQGFNMRVPLVDGHGNFGTIDGDSAAAQRYTEAKLAPTACELLRDIDKDTVSWSLNFDDTLKEPDLLPSRFPNLLANGSSGIAVGFATNIAPHNLAEVIDGVIAQMGNPRISLEELMRIVKGPDFPTGGIIINPEEILPAYATGRGKLYVRAKVEVENGQNGKKLLVISEIPYTVNKTSLLQKIQALREEKKGILTAISDIRDESDHSGMRAVVELRRDSDANKVLQYLYKYTDLQTTFGVNMISIAGGKPQQLGILEMNRYYIEHQKEVEKRRVRFDLEAARAREEILAGLIIAVQNIDRVIKIIRSSATVPAAREALRAAFSLSERQANAILDLRLQRLTALEIEKLEKELFEVRSLIASLEEILSSKQKLAEVIIKSLQDIKRRYKDPRRTAILSKKETSREQEQALTAEDFKIVEEIVVGVDREGYIRRVPVKNFSRSAKEDPATMEEALLDVQVGKTNMQLLLFTDAGRAYTLPAEQIPECKWRDRGANPAKLFAGWEKEKPLYFMLYEALPEGNLLFYTKNGMVKRSAFSEYAVKKSRYNALSLKDNDVLVGVEPETEGASVLFVTKNGMSLNFEKAEIAATGRVTAGVKGMQLDVGDEVIFAGQISDEGEVIVWTEKGYAKRSLAADYDLAVRGRKGLKTFDFKRSGANGTRIISALYVKEPYSMLCLHQNGTTETLLTEEVHIEPRLSGGKPYCLAVLGDELTGVVKV